MKKGEEKHLLVIKVDLTKEEWQEFKETVKPIPVQVALASMIRASLQVDKKPFSEIILDVFKDALKGYPS